MSIQNTFKICCKLICAIAHNKFWNLNYLISVEVFGNDLFYIITLFPRHILLVIKDRKPVAMMKNENKFKWMLLQI